MAQVIEQKKLSSDGNQSRILRNTSYLTGAFIIQKVLSFVYFIFVAKALGAFDLGLYDPAKAMIPILLILIDFSLSPVLTREVARKPENAYRYLSNVLAVKALLAVILLVLFGFVTNFSTFGAIERSVIYLIALIVAFDSFTSTFFAIFRGLQNMKFEAIGMIITQLATIALGLTMLATGYGLRGLFLATFAGSIFNFFYSLTVLRKHLGAFPSFSWDKKIIKTFLVMAIPFALTAILAKAFSYSDRFILLLGNGREAVGFYATANKLTFALEFIPSAFAAAFYPAMSQYFITDKKQLAKIFERALYYLLILAIPISVGMVLLAHEIFFALWQGDYSNSILPFQIMISFLIVIFLNFPVGSFLNATNNQRANTINMAIAVLVNIVLNLLLVENYAHVSAAVATVVSMTLLFGLGLFKVNKLVSYEKRGLIRTAIYAAIIALIAGIISKLITPYVSLFVSLPFFGITYLGAMFGMKIISREDMRIAFNAIRKKRI